jgi:hypothetical protein
LKLHRRDIPTGSINRTCPEYTQTRHPANKTMLRFPRHSLPNLALIMRQFGQVVVNQQL